MALTVSESDKSVDPHTGCRSVRALWAYCLRGLRACGDTAAKPYRAATEVDREDDPVTATNYLIGDCDVAAFNFSSRFVARNISTWRMVSE